MNTTLLTLPFLVQGALMGVDEGWFHRRRGLPRWERIGHPLDTLTVTACYAWLVFRRPEMPGALAVYAALAIASCLFVTKDEFVHKQLCSAKESWIHALLFGLHPIAFFAAGLLWLEDPNNVILKAQLALTSSFALYQGIYWGPWNRTPTRSAV
ncbi:hypothetical protein [Pendulispora albinea]|uniref:Uncharacterized protein n=1 Tax=Pendulispora albinea TaxID=2741071 RepID=A0ABZ2LWL2_9BACT